MRGQGGTGRLGVGEFSRPPRCRYGLFHVESAESKVAGGRWRGANGQKTGHDNAGNVLRLVLVCPPFAWMSAFAHLEPHQPRELEARPRLPADAGARGLWPGRVRQEEHSGAQSAGAARWLCFIWPRRKFIFRCGLHTHTSVRKQSQPHARDAAGWARVLVTCQLAANVPRPCRSHKADVQGQEPVLPSFFVP